MIFHPLKINTPFTCHEFLSPKFSCAKRKYGAMLKKEKNIHAKKHERKNAYQRA